MIAENNLTFLKDRIFDIKSALLYSMSNELIRIPVSIITVLRIDKEGQIWFFVKRPSAILFEDDKVFPARLQFYRKGKPFYLHVAGTACINESKEEIHSFACLAPELENKAMKDMVLIKLKMRKAEYYEQRSQPDYNNNLIRNIFQNVYTALFKPAGNYRPFDLNTHAA